MNTPNPLDNSHDIVVNTDPLVNDVNETTINETPKEIEDFIVENGITDKKYTCYVKKFPTAGGSVPQVLPWSENSKYPKAEDLGGQYGPGRYLIMFNWRTKNPEGKMTTTTKEYKMELGEEWEEIAMENAAKRMIESRKRMDSLAQKENLRRAMNGQLPGDTSQQQQPRNNNDGGFESLMNSATALRNLGVPIGGNQQDNSTNMIAMFQMMNAQTQKSSEQMMQMMMMIMKSNSDQMVAMMNNKPQTHNNAFQEVTQLMGNMMDMKAVLSPEKKSSLDRIFDVLEGAVPTLVQMSQDKRAEMAGPYKAMPQVAEIGSEAEQLKYMVEKLDKKHGPDNTDTILDSLGWARPEGMRFEKEIVVEPDTEITTEGGED